MYNEAIVFLMKGKTQQADIFKPLLLLFLPDYNTEVMSGYGASIFGIRKTKITS